MDDRLTRPDLPPALLPAIAIVAVLVSAMVLASWSTVRDGHRIAAPTTAPVTSRATVPTLHVRGSVEQVRRGAHTALVIRAAGNDALMRIVVDRARVVVPEGSIYVVGTTADLAAGQQVELELAPGTRYVAGAHAIGVRVGSVRTTDIAGG